MLNLRSTKTLTSIAAVAAAVLLMTVVLTHTGRASPRPAPRPAPHAAPAPPNPADEVGRGGVVQGTYATAINIHNPNLTAVQIFKQATVALPEETTPIGPSAFHAAPLLAPGQALEVDCQDIEERLLGIGGPSLPTNAFLKGFVTLLATGDLDVVGVYSVGQPPVLIPAPSYATDGSTETLFPAVGLEMLQVPERFITLPPPNATVAQPPRRFAEYSAKFLCGSAHVT